MKKKILFIFCSFFIFNVNKVNASTIEVETPIENPLMKFIETEKRYMWYKEVIEDLGYNNEILNLENLYIDEKDYTIEYSEWKEYNGEDLKDIEVRKWYNYQTILPLKNIEISSDKTTEIAEIEVLVNNENIDYNIACTECSVYERDYLNDKKIDKDNTYNLNRRGKILLVLDKEYPLNEIEIKIYKKSLNDEKFKICFTKEQYKYDNTILKDNLSVNNKYNSEIKVESFKIDDTWTIDTQYSDINKTLNYIENNWYTKVDVYEEYRKVIKKYHYYNVNREYIDGYYKINPTGDLTLKKDNEKFKLFYIYEFLESSNETDTMYNYYPQQKFTLPSFEYPTEYKNLNEEEINTSNLKNYNNIKLSDTDKEKIPKIDVSKFKTKKVKDNNISEYFNSKNLKIAGISLSVILLIILFINSRYRKS